MNRTRFDHIVEMDTPTIQVQTKLITKAFNPFLAQPKGLDRAGKKAYSIVMKLIKKYDLDPGGCQTFYAPAEWAARGEKYATQSKLVVVYDGGDIRLLTDEDAGSYKLVSQLVDDLQKHGMSIEECTCWYSGIYLNDQPGL